MKDYNKIYTSITEFSEQLRARIIDRIILIEALVSENLVDLTSTDITRPSIAKHLFSDATTLETKVNLFTSLNKAGAFKLKSPNKTLNADLKYLQKLRNYLAHSLLDTTNEFMEIYDFTYIRYRSITTKGDQYVYIYYKDKEENFEDRIYNSMLIVERINRTTDSLMEIQENLKK
jgi:hypothetical protein